LSPEAMGSMIAALCALSAGGAALSYFAGIDESADYVFNETQVDKLTGLHARVAMIGAAALAMVTFGLALRLDWYGVLPGHLLAQESTLIFGKEQLALPRLLHALSLAWLIARFVPRDSAWMHTAWAAAIGRVGRYSLETFCLGLFLSWAAGAVLHFHPGHLAALDPPLIAAGCVLMALFARFLDRKRTILPQIQTA
ncbi:MAG TPA: OpgC domain-containing protein, partial [Acetobacteraceae bacterium]|nr:OpgC domain-containing protein [Acetobacteraceae bacterium]